MIDHRYDMARPRHLDRDASCSHTDPERGTPHGGIRYFGGVHSYHVDVVISWEPHRRRMGALAEDASTCSRR
jgi:hypothetical protein